MSVVDQLNKEVSTLKAEVKELKERNTKLEGEVGLRLGAIEDKLFKAGIF